MFCFYKNEKFSIKKFIFKKKTNLSGGSHWTDNKAILGIDFCPNFAMVVNNVKSISVHQHTYTLVTIPQLEGYVRRS